MLIIQYAYKTGQYLVIMDYLSIVSKCCEMVTTYVPIVTVVGLTGLAVKFVYDIFCIEAKASKLKNEIIKRNDDLIENLEYHLNNRQSHIDFLMDALKSRDDHIELLKNALRERNERPEPARQAPRVHRRRPTRPTRPTRPRRAPRYRRNYSYQLF